MALEIKTILLAFLIQFLLISNIGAQIIDSDSATFRQISMTVPAKAGQKINFYNNGRPFRIHQWAEPWIKVNASIATKNVDRYLPSELFEALNIYIDTALGAANIISFSRRPGLYSSGSAEGSNDSLQETTNILANLVAAHANKTYKPFAHISYDPGFEIFLPKDADIYIESYFSKTSLEDNFSKINVKVKNATFITKDIDTLDLASSLCTTQLGNIVYGRFNLNNDEVDGGSFSNLKIRSGGSKLSFVRGQTLTLESERDVIQIDSLEILNCRKSFGLLKIGWVGDSIDFSGQAGDFRVNSLSNKLRSATITTSWANIKLPVAKLASFNLRFSGLSLIKSGSLRRVELPDPNDSTRHGFSIVAGHAPYADIIMNCQKCTIDLR